MTLGADISAWQERVDFERFRQGGRSFVMIRAGAGNKPDSRFAEHYDAAIAAGVDVGAYWFSYAADTQAALQEAGRCIEVLSGRRIVYPVAFDYEAASAEGGALPSRKALTDMALAFCREIRAAGFIPAVYTNPDYLANRYEAERLSEVDLWLAAWGRSDPPTADNSGRCDIWQYAVVGSRSDVEAGRASATGEVAGIEGAADVDISYRDYAAEYAARERWNRIEDLPKYYRDEIAELVRVGALKGGSGGLDLSEDMVRCMIVAKRYTDIKG